MCDAQRLLADNTTSGQWGEDNLAPTTWVDVFDHALEVNKNKHFGRLEHLRKQKANGQTKISTLDPTHTLGTRSARQNEPHDPSTHA